MTRIAVPAFEDAPADSQPALEAVRKQLGVVPNLFRLIAKSPAALAGYLGLQGALRRSLNAKTRERIALAVAEVNGCDYCLSAHTYLALNVAKLSEEEIALNRRGGSHDAEANAAVRLAAKVAQTRGHVSELDLASAREQGLTDAQLVEIVALVAENTFTNYLNSLAGTEIDFPVVRAKSAA